MKKVKTALKILLCLIIVLAYPVYALVVWNLSKSPDDLSKFPKAGIWFCQEENFTMTINLSEIGEDENPISCMKIVIEFDENEQSLDCFSRSGHGTLFAPVAPAHILYFESADISVGEAEYVNFSTSKYKFNENDFYLLDISISKNNKAEIFKNNMDLHFIRQK